MRFKNLLLLTFIIVIVLGSFSVIGVNAWNGDTCPEGYIGAPPNCIPDATLPNECEPGEIGTYPNCFPEPCPSGFEGTPPNCIPIFDPSSTCPPGTIGLYPDCVPISQPTPTLVPKSLGSLDNQGICKFTEVKTGVVGESIIASGKGYPSVMRLKVDGIIYFLPVIENTIVMNFETNNWTAEFATVDPLTGQPLVPEGEFEVGCFGVNGTADGAGNKVTITR